MQNALSRLNSAQIPPQVLETITAAGAKDLRAAAEAFEAMFLQEIIEQGREGGLGPPLLSSEAGKTFRGMLDAEQASAAAHRVNLGIADALVNQLAPALKAGRN